MRVEEIRLVAKSLQVLLLYCSGSPVVTGVDVSAGDEPFQWLGKGPGLGVRKFEFVRLPLDFSDVPAALNLMHGFAYSSVNLPHVVEVLSEIISGAVSPRYSVTLLRTAWEQVIGAPATP
jgi:hypothetical protein